MEKVFTLRNTWMIGKNSMKHHYLKKKNFNSHLNMKDTDADYTNAKRVCKEFEIKNLGEYHDFMFKVIQLLADIFENFQNK